MLNLFDAACNVIAKREKLCWIDAEMSVDDGGVPISCNNKNDGYKRQKWCDLLRIKLDALQLGFSKGPNLPLAAFLQVI